MGALGFLHLNTVTVMRSLRLATRFFGSDPALEWVRDNIVGFGGIRETSRSLENPLRMVGDRFDGHATGKRFPQGNRPERGL